MGTGNNKKITIDVEFRTQMNQMKNGISNLQKLIDGINFDPSKKANFKNIFSKFESEFSNMENRLKRTGGVFDSKELTSFEKELQNVFNLYGKITGEVEKVTGMDDGALSKLIPSDMSKNFKEISNAIKQYEKDLEKTIKSSKEYVKVQEEIDNLDAKKKDYNRTKSSLQSKQLNQQLNLGQQTKKFNDMTSSIQDADNKLNKLTKDIEDYKKKIGSLKTIEKLEETNKEIEKYEKRKKSIPTDQRYKSDEARSKAISEVDKKILEAKNNKTKYESQAENISSVKEMNKLLEERVKLEKDRNNLISARESIQKKMNDSSDSIELIEERLKEVEEKEQKCNQQMEEFKKKSEEAASEIAIKEFEKLKNTLSNFKIDGFDPKSAKNIEELKKQLEGLEKDALQQLKNQFPQIEKELEKFGISFEKLEEGCRQAGDGLTELGERSKELEEVSSRLKYFFKISNGFRLLREAVRKAYEEIQTLDKVMTETAVVTDFSVGDMWDKLPEYTEIANKFGSTIEDAYKVMTIFYQQGLETNAVFALGEQTMQMARIAGLDYADAADRMTNALRGFNMELTETNAQRVNDVYSELAAISASDVDELSTAMTKTASLANSANMEFENTAAFIAQIVETTRESAETAGTALKTVIARFSEVKELYNKNQLVGQTEEGEEVDINKVGTALRAAGINLNEFLTGAKGLDEIFIELSEKWSSLDLMTQRYIATMAAGSRQQSRFLALMGNNERLTELIGAAYESSGASAEQFGKTQESLESKINQLKNAYNELLMGITNSDLIKGIIDHTVFLLNAFNKLTQGVTSVGSSMKKLTAVIAIFFMIKKAVLSVVASITKTVKDVMQKEGVEAGRGFINSIERGMKSAKSTLKFAKSFDSGGSIVSAQKFGNMIGQKISNAIEENLDGDILKSFQNEIIKTSEQAESPLTKLQGTWIALSNTAKSKGINIEFNEEINNIDTLNSAIQALLEKIEELEKNPNSSVLEKDIENVKNLAKGVKKAVEGNEDLVKGSIRTKAEIQQMGQSLSTVAISASMLTSMLSNTFSELWGEGNKASDVLGRIGSGLGTIFTVFQLFRTLANIEYKEGGLIPKSLGGPAGMAIAAGLALIVELIKYIVERFKDLDITDELNTALDSTKQKIDDLESAWDNFQNAKDTLADLTEGTLEWKNALTKANLEILELIKKYPELAEAVSTNTDGLWEIDYDKFQQVLENELNDQVTLTALSGLNDVTKQYESQLKELNKKYNSGKIDETEYNLQKQQIELEKNSSVGLYASSFFEQKGYNLSSELVNILTENFGELIQGVEWYSIDEITTEMKEKYASLANLNYNEDKDNFLDQEGKVVDVSSTTIRALLSANQVLENLEKTAKDLQSPLESLDKQAKTKTGQTKNENTLSKILAGNSNANLNGVNNLKYVSEDFQNMAEENKKAFFTSVLGLDNYDENQINDYIEQLNNKIEEQAKKISEVQANKRSSLITTLLGLDLIDQKLIEEFVKKLEIELVDKINALIGAMESKIEIGKIKTIVSTMNNLEGEQLKEYVDTFNNISFGDAIEGYTQLQECAKSTNKEIRETAEMLLDSDAFSASKMIQQIGNSSDWEDIEKKIKKFIKSTNEVSADNVRELASEFEKLNDLLDTGVISATQLADVFEAMAKNDLDFTSFSEAVMDGITAVTTYEGLLDEIEMDIENFDLGIDSMHGIDSLRESIDALREDMDQNIYGNPQILKLLRSVYTKDSYDFDSTSSQKELEEMIKTAYNQLERDTYGNGAEFWRQVAQDQRDMGDFKVTQSGNNLSVSVGDMTTEEVVDEISKAYGLTESAAKKYLAMLESVNVGLIKQLSNNDLKIAAKAYADALDAYGEYVFTTKDEIQTFADALGVSYEAALEQISEYSGKELKVAGDNSDKYGLDIFNSNGELKDVSTIVDKLTTTFSDLNKDIKKVNSELNLTGKEITETKNFETANGTEKASELFTIEITEGNEKGYAIDYEKMSQILVSMGIEDEAKRNQIIDEYANQTNLAIYRSIDVYEKTADGGFTKVEKAITENSVEDLEKSVDNIYEIIAQSGDYYTDLTELKDGTTIRSAIDSTDLKATIDNIATMISDLTGSNGTTSTTSTTSTTTSTTTKKTNIPGVSTKSYIPAETMEEKYGKSTETKYINLKTYKKFDDKWFLNGGSSGYTEVTDENILAQLNESPQPNEQNTYAETDKDGKAIAAGIYPANMEGFYKLKPNISDKRIATTFTIGKNNYQAYKVTEEEAIRLQKQTEKVNHNLAKTDISDDLDVFYYGGYSTGYLKDKEGNLYRLSSTSSESTASTTTKAVTTTKKANTTTSTTTTKTAPTYMDASEWRNQFQKGENHGYIFKETTSDGKIHRGYDYWTNTKGDNIKSFSSGEIYDTIYDKNGWGYQIIVKDEDNNLYYYSHLQGFNSLKKGDKINAGDTIGKEGKTGKSSGYHLDFMISKAKDGQVNKSNFIDPEEFFKTLEGKNITVVDALNSFTGYDLGEPGESSKKVSAETTTANTEELLKTEAKNKELQYEKAYNTLNDISDVEREINTLEKERNQLSRDGLVTYAAQQKNLSDQIDLLKEKKSLQARASSEYADQIKTAQSLYSGTGVNDYISWDESTGKYSISSSYQTLKNDPNTSKEKLETINNAMGEIVPLMQNYKEQKQLEEDIDWEIQNKENEKEDLRNSLIDQVGSEVKSVISKVGELAQAAVQMVEAIAQSIVDGIESFLKRTLIQIDDETDINAVAESLNNIQKRNTWEFERLIKKSIGYQGTNAFAQTNLFDNLNDQMENTLLRLQNSRQLYENSVDTIKYFQGSNFQTKLTDALNGIYGELFGTEEKKGIISTAVDTAESGLNTINESLNTVNNLTKPVENALETVENAGTKALKLIGIDISTEGSEEAGNSGKETVASQINNLTTGLATYLKSLKDIGKDSFEKIIDFFNELTPTYVEDLQIIDTTELGKYVQEGLSTILTVDDTIIGQIATKYVDYILGIQEIMVSETENIRKAEEDILECYEEISTILETGEEEYLQLEEEIYQAIVSEKQSILDELSALNESITQADSKLIDTLKSNIETIRQQRDNQEKETELQNKEARLAYLKQDTSGANRQEILQLEKELKDNKQDYTDQLIDQKIDELEKQNQLAEEQRQIQIDLLQGEIDDVKKIKEQVELLTRGLANVNEAGEIDEEVYKNIMYYLKKTEKYAQATSKEQESQLETWDELIRYGSIYKYFSEGMGAEQYSYLKLAKELIDEDTGLSSTWSNDDSWDSYTAINEIKNVGTVVGDAVKTAAEDIVDKIDEYTKSSDKDYSEISNWANTFVNMVQIASGAEYAVTKTVEDVADAVPGIATQLTDGMTNLAKAAASIKGSSEASIGIGSGGIGGSITADPGIFTYLIAAGSNFAAAAADAVALGMKTATDAAPGVVDMGVAAATTIMNGIDKITGESYNGISEEESKQAKEYYEQFMKDYGKKIDEKQKYYTTMLTELEKKKIEAEKSGKYTPEELEKINASIDTLKMIYENGLTEIDKYKSLALEEYNAENSDFETMSAYLNKLRYLYNQTDISSTTSAENIIENLGYDANTELTKEDIEKLRKVLENQGITADSEVWKWFEEKLADEKLTYGEVYDFLKQGIDSDYIANDTLSNILDEIKGFNTDLTSFLNWTINKKDDNTNNNENKKDDNKTDEDKTDVNEEDKNKTNASTQQYKDLADKFGIGYGNLNENSSKEEWIKVFSDWAEKQNSLKQKIEATQVALDAFKLKLNDVEKGMKDKFDYLQKAILAVSESLYEMKSKFINIINSVIDLINKLPGINISRISAFATGGHISRTQTALTGEIGPELALHKNGTATLLGTDGPEITKVHSGDEIYTAEQTRKLFSGEGFAINRYAEGTGALLAPITDLGTNYLKRNSTEINRENVFNFNLDLGNLTVDSPDRVNEVADKVWNKITTQVSSSIWPFNNL